MIFVPLRHHRRRQSNFHSHLNFDCNLLFPHHHKRVATLQKKQVDCDLCLIPITFTPLNRVSSRFVVGRLTKTDRTL